MDFKAGNSTQTSSYYRAAVDHHVDRLDLEALDDANKKNLKILLLLLVSSIRKNFVNDAQKNINMIIEWKGKGVNEKKFFNVKNIIRRVIKRNGRGRSEIS